MPPDVPATVNAGVVVGVATEIRPPVNETLVTVPDVAGAAQTAVPPLTVRTLPVEPILRDATDAAPFPSNNDPVAQPVGITKAKVPLVVTGLPVMVNPVGALNATLVTVPVGAAPLDAAVISPFALTVMLAYVNEPTLPFTVAKVNALEPEVVASPEISDAVKGFPPRTTPVNVLPVAVPPLAIGTIEKVAVGAEPAPPPKTKSPAGSTPEAAQADAEEK